VTRSTGADSKLKSKCGLAYTYVYTLGSYQMGLGVRQCVGSVNATLTIGKKLNKKCTCLLAKSRTWPTERNKRAKVKQVTSASKAFHFIKGVSGVAVPPVNHPNSRKQ
jgi:hypothetical protein